MAAHHGSAAIANLRSSSAVKSELLDDPQIHAVVRSLTDLSPAFARLLLSDPLALPVLAKLDEREVPVEDASTLVAWSKREMLRIACRDTAGLDQVRQTGAHLAQLATDVLKVCMATTPGTDELVVVGMGKLGAGELNYASDIDIMFSGNAGEQCARNVASLARQCFKVDTNLRPEGRNGPLIRSVESFRTYWAQWASAWEFQALLKAQPLAGDPELSKEWQHAAEDALWRRRFSSEDLDALRKMKHRSEQMAASAAGSEVKRGSGGIRDVEFSVQLLQLVHGEADESIRVRDTLGALDALASGGYVSTEDAKDLADCYALLRNVEHRAQMVELQQTHTVPRDPHARTRIADSLYMDLSAFDTRLRSCRSTVRHAFERLYFRPLLEAFSGNTALTEGDVTSRLNALGFSDAQRTKIAVAELTEGLHRSSRLMSQMMPLLLDWLSESPDPDMGLLSLRRLLSAKRAPAHVIAAFRDSPEVARRVCRVLGTSPLFETALTRHPELFEVINARDLVSSDVSDRMHRTVHWRTDSMGRRTSLARFNDVERNRIAMNEVLGVTEHETACVSRSALADAVLSHALAELAGNVPVVLVALGRYGGEELGPGSDLDVMLVHDGEQAEAERVAQQLLASVNHPSPAFQLYELDYSLRPEGKHGPLARSLASCREYYERWASTWERQALLRSRYVCGDAELARSLFGVVEDFVWDAPFGIEQEREIRHLKARMETERLPRGEDSRFHLKLGKGSIADAEWTIQLLQLRHGVRSNNTLSALRLLIEGSRIDPRDASALEEAWRFCSGARDRVSLLEGRPVNSLPTARNRLGVLARSLGSDASALQSEYLRLTRRCREVTERLFYEAPVR